MKAYWVEVKDGEYGMYIHAESPSKAKSQYAQVDPELERADFTSLRANRVPDLDGKPFTDDVMNESGRYIDEEWQGKNLWLEWCSCSLCTAAGVLTLRAADPPSALVGCGETIKSAGG